MPLHDLTPELRTRLRRMEKVVGIFVAVAALLLLAGFVSYVYHTAARKGWFTPKCPYYTFVRSADGLQVGDPVLLMGFSVGAITVIDAEPPESSYNVYVGFEIRKPYYGYIWSDSVAQVSGGGILGGRRLEVLKGRSGAPTAYEADGRVAEILVDGVKIPLHERPQGVALVMRESPALSERAEQLASELQETLPRITAKVEAILANAEQLSARIDCVVAQTQPLVANLDAITTNLRNPNGSLGRWMLTPELHKRLDATLAAADANLSVLSGSLHNLDGITSRLRAQLDANPDTLADVSGLLRDVDDLVQGLKRHWLLRSAFPQPESGRMQQPLAPLPGLPQPQQP
jgi:ABC-type transporter Mla subunit MlaD